jgi:voltage-gated potassium channel
MRTRGWGEMKGQHQTPGTKHVQAISWPMSLLFLVLLLVFVYLPIDIDLPISLFALMFSFILLAAVFAVHSAGQYVIGASALALISLLLSWAATLLGHPPLWLEALTLASASLFLLYTLAAIAVRIWQEDSVSIHTLSAAMSLYLLLGILGGLAFTILEVFKPGSLAAEAGTVATTNIAVDLFPPLLYFSFTALTTLGMGDIFPVTAAARSLTILEAVCGQIYLVVMVAFLVSIFASQRAERNK